MKIADLYNLEQNNESQIILIREGLFLRAYERSALRFVENIADFTVLKRYYKIINTSLVYLGFPAQNLEKLMKNIHKDAASAIAMAIAQTTGIPVDTNAVPVIPVSYGYILNGFKEKQDFVKWKASIADTSKHEDSDSLLMQERVKPNFKPKSPLSIYKSGYDVLLQVYRLVQNFKREYKYTLGEELKKDAFQLALYTYRYAQGKNAKELEFSELSYPLLALSQIDVMRLRLRILADMHSLSPNSFSRINTDLEYLKDQLSDPTSLSEPTDYNLPF